MLLRRDFSTLQKTEAEGDGNLLLRPDHNAVMYKRFYGPAAVTSLKRNTCCWRESTSVLQLYCGYLPMKYIIEQQTVLFYRRIVVLRSLLYQKVGYVQSLLSKFEIQSLSRPKHELKLYIWDTFVSQTMCHGH